MQGSDPLAELGDLIVLGLRAAQKDLTKGISFLDVQRGIKEVTPGKLASPTELHLALLLTFKQNKFRSCKDFSRFSDVPIEGYKYLSEWQESDFKGYSMDDIYVVKNAGAPKINFKKHMDMLLSPAGSEDQIAFEKQFQEWGPLFLDGEAHENVIFASFPRSGNTFLRKLLESITGIFTGSDNHTLMSLLTVPLLLGGFKGETHCANTVWVSKSHFPIQLPFAYVHKGSKAIVCIRSPLDAGYSAFNLVYTVTHNLTVQEDTFQKFPEDWDKMVKIGGEAWIKWSDYWREVARSGEIPVYFFRFEDLKLKPADVLMGILTFLLDGREIKGTYLEQRILQCTAPGSKASFLYKPRQSQALHDVSRYTEEQKVLFEAIKADNPYFYGFSDKNDPSNCHYEPEEFDPSRDTFRTISEKAVETVKSKDYKPQQKFINKPGTGFRVPFLDPAYWNNIQKAQLEIKLKDDI